MFSVYLEETAHWISCCLICRGTSEGFQTFLRQFDRLFAGRKSRLPRLEHSEQGPSHWWSSGCCVRNSGCWSRTKMARFLLCWREASILRRQNLTWHRKLRQPTSECFYPQVVVSGRQHNKRMPRRWTFVLSRGYGLTWCLCATVKTCV